MQPIEKVSEIRPLEMKPRSADKDGLRDALKDQGERGQTKSDIVLLSVQRLLRRGAITNLAKMLGRMHPADIAKIIVHLSSPKEKREVFELVRGESKRGQVLSELIRDRRAVVAASASTTWGCIPAIWLISSAWGCG